MIHIVTGKINSSKSTTMEQLHHELGGDGFITKKYMKGNKVESYSLQRLSTGNEYPFIQNEKLHEEVFMSRLRIGPYVFNEAILPYIESVFDELLNQEIEPIFLDEIGLLELDGQCFAKILSKLIVSKKELYITMREDMITKATIVFNMNDVEIITTT